MSSTKHETKQLNKITDLLNELTFRQISPHHQSLQVLLHNSEYILVYHTLSL